MDALEWDEEEIITRHRSWPEGTGLDRIHARPRVRVLGMQESVERHLGDPLPIVLHAVTSVEPPTRKMDRGRIHAEMEEVEIDLDELDDDEIIELGSGEIAIEDPRSGVLPAGSYPGRPEAESVPFFFLSELEAGRDARASDPHAPGPYASEEEVVAQEIEPVFLRKEPVLEAAPAPPARDGWDAAPVPAPPPSEAPVRVDTTYPDLPASWSSVGLPKVELDLPIEDDGVRRSSSLSPVARAPESSPPRRARSGGWPTAIALALTACAGVALVFGTVHLWPRKGALHVDLTGPAVALGGVFVDGRLACPNVPCVVDSLDVGAHVVEIVMPEGQSPLSETHVVRSGTQTIALMHPPASSPPPLAAAPKARVILGSKIPSVKVDVDGKPRGTLPITLADLTPGEHTLRFTARGRKAVEKKIALSDYETQRLEDVALELETGTLDIALATPGARVLLAPRTGYRKNLAGPFPKSFDVAPGSYDVIALRPGFRPQVTPIEISDAAPRAEVSIELSPMAFVPPRSDIYE